MAGDPRVQEILDRALADIAGARSTSALEQIRVRVLGRSGELTGREFVRLEAQEARIRAEEFRYRRNDGHLGPRERADLQRDLSRESRRIAQQKHDGQIR